MAALPSSQTCAAEDVLAMKYPSNQEFKALLRRMPKWILLLILLMLFGRFIIVGIWQLYR